ncbi:MAG: ABC transporter ATP-binding protein [Anaerolineae bacterium]
MTTIIRAENMTRRFGNKVALDGLNLEVKQGEVFGFLGPNGAGKTTTVRLLNGVLGFSAGQASVLGFDVATQAAAVRRRVGVLTENPCVYDGLTARENLAFVGDLYGVPTERLTARINTVLAEFDLADRADDHVASYSKGMRQRLAIARVILHEPELIFLDEPTSGLDPEAARMATDLIQTLSRQAGRTVFLCTHNLDEAQRLCDRVGVIDKGSLQAIGTPSELARQLWQGLWVDFDLHAEPSEPVRAMLRQSPFVKEWSNDGGILTVQVENEENIPDIVAVISTAGGRIYRVNPKLHSLSDIYFRIQQDLRSNQGGTQ